MSIKIHDGTSFKDVSDVYIYPSNSNPHKANRVWVHNGTKYMLVKGRILEVEWELDMSDWMGATWNTSLSHYSNLSKGMFILDSGDLLNLVDYAIKNNSEVYSGRYPLQVIRSDDGNISCWTSTYTSSFPYKRWTTANGEIHYEEPKYMCYFNGYLVMITKYGMLYSYSLDGVKGETYENSTWHTVGSSSYLMSSNRGIFFDATNECIYFLMNGDEHNEYYNLYRIGFKSNGAFYSPKIHTRFLRDSSTEPCFSLKGLVSDRSTSKMVVSLECYDSASFIGSFLNVYSTDFTYNSPENYNDIVCETSVINYTEDSPLYAKDGYVYTITTDGAIRKYNISNMTLVWENYRHYSFHGSLSEPFANGVRCDDYGDDAFVLPNGTIVYFDGTIDRPPDWFPNYSDSVDIEKGVFNEDLGVGYVQLYYSDYSSGYNANGLAVNKILKLKEVKK